MHCITGITNGIYYGPAGCPYTACGNCFDQSGRLQRSADRNHAGSLYLTQGAQQKMVSMYEGREEITVATTCLLEHGWTQDEINAVLASAAEYGSSSSSF
ncbi:hypothetical protein BAUCODRAFT_330846 [Baudoinia panamericana UAMH 10762]|uniref:Uncharacterized protein n=1 Tax=Baudoinia panamericana (strain UAMH 10762) TaxID=717646 RepID=M2M4K1_BAUPA|nr:uncharacterized protein BAUCODRAFT_330846 [Baudoinia panamericana UAMH 10762]EMC91511.1 hypothetical protein BAUCODRAFT_330846 [Baudoinia panamericana UAMH 10762]